MTIETHPWEQAPTGVAADRMAATAATIPRIETDRLILRAPRIGDFPAYAEVYQSDRWHDEGTVSREYAWLDFCQMVAGWLLRGTGILSVDRRADGTHLGFVILNHEYGDPELELGWVLTEAAEGEGYASEAGAALRDWAARTLGVTGLVSYIGENNLRSIRVAEGLGAVLERARGPEDCLVYRHPGPEAQR